MNAILYLLFAASGAAALVYQVAWMRELQLVFGASAPAVAIVLAAFMLGLALGAILLGRFMARWSGSPWRLYGILELLIAGCAAAFPFALRALDPVYRSAYGTPWFWPLLVLVAALLLLPPTMLLGGTLPVMARALDRAPGRFARNLTWLYAANTGGAALGAFLAPFVLLPLCGLRTTQIAVPVVSAIVGAVAFVLGGRAAADWGPVAAAPRPRPRAARARGGPRPLAMATTLALAAASGFVVLLLEVATSRLLAIYLGQSTYGFGVMLTCFILGLALAAWLGGFLAARIDSMASAIAWIALAAGAAIGLMMVVLERLPWWLADGQQVIHGTSHPFLLMMAYQFLLALLALLPATVVVGMIFPLLLSLGEADAIPTSRSVGLIYGVNTAGSVGGALLGGFLLVPALGPHGAIAAAGALILTCGLLAAGSEFRADRARRRTFLAQIGLAITAVIVLAAAARPDPQVLARSPWLYSRSPAEHRDYQSDVRQKTRSVEFLAHDIHGTVVVGRLDRARPPHRFFSVNGKIDGGTGPDDMHTQVALGTWPCLLFDGGRRSPGDVLVIGLGTGVTAGAALSFPLNSLDIVEISPTMPAVARRYFSDMNRRALDDPRTRVILGDGRHHLGYAARTYDVIISEPSNPWISGIGFLFTLECFQRMHAALVDGGVACQWLQVYDLTPAAIAAAIATFTAVFPSTVVLMTQDEPSDLLLLGFKRPRDATGRLLDVADIEAALARHRVPSEYEPYAPRRIDDLLDHFVLGPEGIAGLARGAPHHTDDRAYLEFEAPKQLATPGDMTPALQRLATHWEPAVRYLTLPESGRPGITDRSKNVALYWRLGLRTGVDPLELAGPPAQGAQRLSLADATAIEQQLRDFDLQFGSPSLLHHLAGVLAEMRPVPDVQPPMLERYGPGFEPSVARRHLEQGARLDPENMPLRLNLAINYEYGHNGQRFGEGAELRGAAALYRSILERAPGHVEVRERWKAVARAIPRP